MKPKGEKMASAFNEWWQAEEEKMRQQGADDEIIMGAMRNIAEMAWNAAQPQWQPLETAPQDGTKFLLLGTNNEISFCRWHKEVGAWCYGGLIGPVDHECLWMPLPAAPQGDEK